MLTGLLLLSLLFCVTSGVLNWRWNHSVYWCQRIAPFCCQTHFQRQVSSSLFSPIKENAFSVNSCKSVIIWFSLGFQSKTITKCFDEIFVNIYSTLNRYNSGIQCPNNFPCALLPALPTLFFFFFFFQCSASEIFSAHGTVSSNKMTCFFSIFHENLFSSSPLLLVIFLYLYLLSFRLNTS